VSGSSARHLNRLFWQYTGLSVKTITQTIRRQHVCRQMFALPGGYLNTALELGFYDQSHLIRDFKKHLLLSPGAFLQRFMSDFYNP
jgi:AraC-like DNA-binding protein